MRQKWNEFCSKLASMNEEEKDSYIEKLVRNTILKVAGIIMLCMTSTILFVNFVDTDAIADKWHKLFSKEVEVVEEIDYEKEEMLKIEFAMNSDYEPIKDLDWADNKENLAINYVIGEDMLAVAQTIPEDDAQTRNAFIGWSTAIQNAQDSFSYKQGSAVLVQWNKFAPSIKDDVMYQTLYSEMATRSLLMLDSINDLQHNPEYESYYDTLYSNLLRYERSGNTKYLDEMEETILSKPKSSSDYDVTDKWLAKIQELRMANSSWENNWDKSDE